MSVADPNPNSSDPVERRVREVVLELVHRRAAFTPADIAAAVQAPVARVAAALRAVDLAGILAPLGYRRTLGRRRTRAGVDSVVHYLPT